MVGRDEDMSKFLNDVLVPMATMRGDSIPVSAYLTSADGSEPCGTAAYEKRGIATDVPVWIKKNCMQCNLCAYVCPHGVIRPFVLDEEETAAVDGQFVKMKGMKDKFFSIGISALDCSGCGSCVDVCPARNKALEMKPAEDDIVNANQKRYDYLFGDVTDKDVPFKRNTVKGSQFLQPLLEESPYAKLVTQLFGDRMFIANATGCSSIWGHSAPSTPYTVNKEGRGPAWSNSLFEDNAEFGLGMATSVESRRNELKHAAERLVDVIGVPARAWLATMDDAESSRETGDILAAECEKIADSNEDARFIVDNADMLGSQVRCFR